MHPDRPLVAAVETGGTKFRVAVGTGPDAIAATETIPTTTPLETFEAVLSFIDRFEVGAVGVGAFGPIDLDSTSTSYGRVLATPKPGWSDADVLGALSEAGVPVSIDTDVGAAAIGELTWGAAQGLSDFVYITVGTGIGMGVVIGGRVHHGMGHPEAGHIPLTRLPEDSFPGNCPFHGDCLEGMAAGPAIEARWGLPGSRLAERDEVWAMEATYLAQAVQTLTYVVAPQRVIVGGGVAQQRGLVEQIDCRARDALGGYAASPALQQGIEAYVVAAQLGQDAGLLGALAIGLRALE